MAESPFSEEWIREIDRRVAELDAGTARTVPWQQIRDEALQRLGVGKADKIRFLEQFESGQGDYATDRHRWVDETSLDEIIRQAGGQQSS